MARTSTAAEIPGLNFFSPIEVVGGLGTAARGYLAAIQAADIPTSLLPVHELFVHQSSTGRLTPAQKARHPVALVHINADSIHRFLHFHARSFARASYKIGLWVWELPAFRDEWRKELEYFDEIWAPSAFCQRSVQAVTAKPVTVIPHVVSPHEAPEPGAKEKLRIGASEFMFLYVFDASSFVARKNPLCLVEAFDAAFSGSERVRLVLKISNAARDPEFSAYLDSLAKRNPRVLVLRQTMTAGELAGLMQAADCYVSPHRSEGFGLTVAEAMAVGVPVIATNYGGTADFVTEEVGFPLRFQLAEIERDYGPYAKGAIWADPSREHLQELLKSVVRNPQDAALRGQRARLHMQKHYSPAAIGRRIRDRLSAIGLK